MKPTYYTCPPAKMIASALGITSEQAATVRKLCKGEIKITGNPLFPATNDWKNSCYNPPRRIELILSAINETVGGYGVEAFCTHDDSMHAIASYINTGDTYSPTLLFRHDLGSFRLTTWGDFFENNENKLGLATF